jgi:VWFA-related protein
MISQPSRRRLVQEIMAHVRTAAGVVVLAALAGLAQAQTPAADLKATTTLVLVPTLVKTHAGAPVYTLEAKDFLLTDDGIAQRIKVAEDTGAEPLALVVVVETGGAGGRQLEKYSHLGRYVEELVGGVRHHVAVVAFDSAPHLAAPFTQDFVAVEATLSGLEPGDRGAAILDSLQFAVDQLVHQPPAYRRAILLLSETADHGSQLALDDALRSLSATNTAIYSIAFSSGKAAAGNEASHILNDGTPGPAHGCMARDPEANPGKSRAEQTFDCLGLLAPPLRLAKIAALAVREGLSRNIPETVARLTGGEYFPSGNERAVDRALLAVTHHLPNRYVLSYQPPSPHAGFHALEVRLRDRKDLIVEARGGYWAEETVGDSQARPLLK